MTADPFARFLEAAGAPPHPGPEVMIRCPGHADKNPSLSVRRRPDGVCQIKCFAGCEKDQVLAACDPPLTWEDLYLNKSRKPREPRKKPQVDRREPVAAPAEAEGPGREEEESTPHDAALIAREILDEESKLTRQVHFFARDRGGEIYHYENGVYLPQGDLVIRELVKRWYTMSQIPEKWTKKKGTEVVAYIQDDAKYVDDRPQLDRVNVLNGLLFWKKGIIPEPHNAIERMTVQLPIKYDPDATCPAWEKFVSEVFPADSQILAWEIIAWLMIPLTSIQKAVLLIGEGGNGKSTFLRGVTAFLGRRNVSAVSLQKLEEDRFAPASLVGRLANICPDLPSEHLTGTSVFKSITGGDPITVERKFQRAFEVTPYARLVFSANRPPRTSDSTEAFFQRWAVLHFARTFRGTKEEVAADVLDARLSDPGELSGVLNVALSFLPSVVQKGLTVTDSMRKAADEFRAVTDPVQLWLEAHVLPHPQSVVVKRELHNAYHEYALQHGMQNESDRQFTAAVMRCWPDVEGGQRTIGQKRQWVWLGLGLKAAQPAQDAQLVPTCYRADLE